MLIKKDNDHIHLFQFSVINDDNREYDFITH